ncbi:MAG: hypothetical protein WCA96_08880, partial [Methylocella sp.]
LGGADYAGHFAAVGDHGLLRRWMSAPLILQGAAAMSMERLEAGIFRARHVIHFQDTAET